MNALIAGGIDCPRTVMHMGLCENALVDIHSRLADSAVCRHLGHVLSIDLCQSHSCWIQTSHIGVDVDLASIDALQSHDLLADDTNQSMQSSRLSFLFSITIRISMI
jgi:hypothetical protein